MNGPSWKFPFMDSHENGNSIHGNVFLHDGVQVGARSELIHLFGENAPINTF